MAVNGNVIHTGVKRPLKQDVRISEVQNSGVPLYIYIYIAATKLGVREKGKFIGIQLWIEPGSFHILLLPLSHWNHGMQ